MAGLLGRMTSGLRNTIRTVSAGEAYLSKKQEVKKPEKMPELGVLQFGTRFRGSRANLNPFRSAVRPATGPTVGRPGMQQFKGTGGAFAPESSLQMTQGLRGLASPLGKLDTTQNSFAGALAKDAVANAMDQAKLFQMQQTMNKLQQLFSMVSNIMKASHDASMNSIRNMRA